MHLIQLMLSCWHVAFKGTVLSLLSSRGVLKGFKDFGKRSFWVEFISINIPAMFEFDWTLQNHKSHGGVRVAIEKAFCVFETICVCKKCSTNEAVWTLSHIGIIDFDYKEDWKAFWCILNSKLTSPLRHEVQSHLIGSVSCNILSVIINNWRFS